MTFVAIVVLALWSWRPVREIFAIGALRSAMEGGVVVSSSLRGAPAWIDPNKPDVIVTRLAHRCFGEKAWDRWYQAWLRFFVEGPVSSIELRGGPVKGDVSAAFAALPHVRKLTVHDVNSEDPTLILKMSEEEMTRICKVARAMPKLELLHLLGPAATDVSISPLSGHPKLKLISIGTSDLAYITIRSAGTFKSMPSLTRVTVGNLQSPDSRPHEELFQALTEALPSLTVQQRITSW
jgi:hypothetical protein